MDSLDVVNNMIQACYDDEFPNDLPTLRAFMFDKCIEVEDASNLMGVWTDLIKNNKSFNKRALEMAVANGTVADYVANTYRALHPNADRVSYYFKWFKMWMP